MILDVVVQLEDGSIANIECQRVGYYFPGQRAACYSSDLLMRQYRRVKEKMGKAFSYSQIRKVYTIIFYEKSPAEFRKVRDYYLHYSRQQTDTGVEVDLLQEYIFATLDIFQEYMENKDIENETEAWLTFLSEDDPERILELVEKYPRFREMYHDIYQMCLNTERVMAMFSEELRILDHNTVEFMIDDMQNRIEHWETKAGQLERENNNLRESKRRVEIESILRLIMKKMKKNFTIAEIADQLEMEKAEVCDILDVVERFAPDYPEEAIVNEFLRRKKDEEVSK